MHFSGGFLKDGKGNSMCKKDLFWCMVLFYQGKRIWRFFSITEACDFGHQETCHMNSGVPACNTFSDWENSNCWLLNF